MLSYGNSKESSKFTVDFSREATQSSSVEVRITFSVK